ncbi:hypothetical protein MOD24_17245 [Bacillus haynesii]|uniref:hypothetical protein n=1 Tax=Bacillus haynesii TaxID=1925021 RepID=UPI0022824485|nr:hypothetical protein [Bacillus haynesii]MCY8577593.1 hypothetical protein [Bacillus haynesii]MEC1657061.1 hypothetical protein [Bacillus haynesii]
MSKIIKRKYKKVRIAFKKDLIAKCSENKALAMLIVETYTAWHHRRHIIKIWGMFRKPAYKEFQADYSKNLMGDHLSGRDDIWKSLYYADRELHDKFKYLIPETYAMGDALGVAYKVLRA